MTGARLLADGLAFPEGPVELPDGSRSEVFGAGGGERGPGDGLGVLGERVPALRGDLGESWFNGEPVTQTILNRLPVTLVLMIVSIVLVALIATALGVIAAVRRGWVDQTV